tara:strand:+ start:286 stop:816 length:531 start_codon:yes stop_codon:yes gene_type:complete
MKVCDKCKIEKELSEFHIDNYKKDGHKSVCKACRKTVNRNKLSIERKKFDRNINNSIYRAIKDNINGRKWESLLGFSLKELKAKLENRFDDKMNWNNFGSYWWIDKIIPRSAYRYSNVGNNEFRKCWSVKNMRPLHKVECIKKKNKIIWELIKKYRLYDILPIGLISFDKNERGVL